MKPKLSRVARFEIAVHMANELYPMDAEARARYVKKKMEEYEREA